MANKKNLLLRAVALIFVLFESVMFYLIHIERLDTELNLHYACIIAAAIFSWLTLIIELVTAKANGKSAKDILLSKTTGNMIRIAMLFTLLADYFLVAIPVAKHTEGVVLFLGTQLFIFLHILFNEKDKKFRIANIVSRILLMLIITIVALIILGESVNALAIISVIYYANLCVNAVFAHRSGRGGILLTVGLILFGLCDINVGLSALNDMYVGGFPEGSLLYNILNTEADLIWIFYIPSQTLIPLTLLYTNKTK